MPQMMPINWLFSFFFFICIFMMFNIINYYIFLYNFNLIKFNSLKSFNKKNYFLWKW